MAGNPCEGTKFLPEEKKKQKKRKTEPDLTALFSEHV